MPKISRVEAKNVKRLVTIDIQTPGSTIVIRGQNAQGKSSVLDAVAMALGGEKLCPSEPIRRGEKTALARVTLDDGMVAERRWETFKDGRVKTKLEVRGPEGGVLASPQGVLDKLIGKLSFDPEAFARAAPKDQLSTLRALTGVNTGALEVKRADAYAQRTEVNREVKAAGTALYDLNDLPTPGESIDVAVLLEEQRLSTEQLKVKQRAQDALAHAIHKVAAAKQALIDAERLQADAEFEMDAAPEPGVYPDEIAKLILGAQKTNADVAELERKHKDRAVKLKLYNELEAHADRLTATINEVDAEKERLISGARFPVEGLGFGEDGVTFKGLPLEQASSAETLRVSMAIGLALNPALRVIQIRNGSLLDEKSLAIVQEMAEAADAQVWLEVVGTSGADANSIVIEDGMVEE